MPKISIIMSVYNESIGQLQRSMDSVLWQSFQSYEFIIVLDNPENIKGREYIVSQQKADKRIIFLENEKNIKLWASLNRWIELVRWEYIARMDGDDVCDPRKLQKQVEYLEGNRNVDLLFTGWEEIDEQGNTQVRIPSRIDFQNISKTFFYKSPLLHASMICKRKILEKSTYPEIDRPEDFSLFLDLIHAWYIFDILEENLYSFYIQTQDIEKKYEKIRVFSSNYLRILLKNTSKFWKNIYFWWMFLLVIIQWILSRNRHIFNIFFIRLQDIYKALIIWDVHK